jgi:hypothetical protein
MLLLPAMVIGVLMTGRPVGPWGVVLLTLGTDCVVLEGITIVSPPRPLAQFPTTLSPLAALIA